MPLDPRAWDLPFVRLRAGFRLAAPLMVHTLNGPMLRGALGTALHALGRGGELYLSLFDPPPHVPRAYRLRGTLGRHEVLPADALLQLRLDLFGPAAEEVAALLPAFVIMAHLGFGARGVRAALHELVQEEPGGAERLLARGLAERPRALPHRLGRWRGTAATGLEFLSPLALRTPGLPTLSEVANMGAGRLADLAGVSRPDPIPETPSVWRHTRLIEERRCSRREGNQAFGGHLGELVSSAPLEPDVIEGLWAAALVGVGRHTAFGLGECRVLSEAERARLG